MLRILVTVEEETGYKDLIRMKQVTVVLNDDVLAQIASHIASQHTLAPDSTEQKAEIELPVGHICRNGIFRKYATVLCSCCTSREGVDIYGGEIVEMFRKYPLSAR